MALCTRGADAALPRAIRLHDGRRLQINLAAGVVRLRSTLRVLNARGVPLPCAGTNCPTAARMADISFIRPCEDSLREGSNVVIVTFEFVAYHIDGPLMVGKIITTKSRSTSAIESIGISRVILLSASSLSTTNPARHCRTRRVSVLCCASATLTKRSTKSFLRMKGRARNETCMHQRIDDRLRCVVELGLKRHRGLL